MTAVYTLEIITKSPSKSGITWFQSSKIFSKQLRINFNRTLSVMPSEKWKDVNVSITGGAGFLGSTVFDLCREKGARLTVIDNSASGSHANLPSVRRNWKYVSENVASIDL